MTVNNLAENLLLSVKKAKDSIALIKQIELIPVDILKTELNSDETKKAFWINTYNAFYQVIRTNNPIPASSIYTDKHINIASQKFSLDDIEHGILRRYRIKTSLGYLPNLFAPKIIKELAVENIDYRIHFALNCGAKSCPPIAFYNSEKIDQQLELATLSFLESDCEIKLHKMEIHVTSLFSWFRDDFGGKKGIKRILREKLDIPTDGFQLVFKPYNWEDDLRNFV